MSCAVWRAQLPESFGFNLPNALASDVKFLANFFQSVLTLTADSETKPNDLLLFGRKCFQDISGFVANVRVDYRVDRRTDPTVFNQVPQSGFAIPAYRG